jgi:quercetin dioxygenase-like cupin family protein
VIHQKDLRSIKKGGKMEKKETVKVFQVEEIEWVGIAKGIKRRTLAKGANMILNMYINEKGEGAPEHSHPQELMAILLKGEVEAHFNGEKYILKPGNGYHIPASVIHGPFKTISDEPAMYIDILSPVREVEEYADSRVKAGKK